MNKALMPTIGMRRLYQLDAVEGIRAEKGMMSFGVGWRYKKRATQARPWKTGQARPEGHKNRRAR